MVQSFHCLKRKFIQKKVRVIKNMDEKKKYFKKLKRKEKATDINLETASTREEKVRAVEGFLKKEKEKSFGKGAVIGVLVAGLIFFGGTVAGLIPNVHADFKLMALEHLVDKNYLFQEHADEEAVKEATYKGYISSLGDPYSEYMNKDEFEEFSRELDGKLYGIGVMFSMDYEVDGAPARVMKVFKGYSADKAGIQPGDILLSVNDKSLKNVPQTKIVQMLKGVKGTTVKVTFFRESTGKTFTRELVRQEIKEETVDTKILDDGAGYIEVTSFARDTDKEFKKAIDEMVARDVPGIIIDLRNNPGGLMNACTSMLDYLLPEGTVVTTKFKDGSTNKATSDEAHKIDIPISIIVNNGSASAAEMFTGAMQDYNRAIVVGTQSFGKGIVQNIYPLRDGSAVKLTNAEYFTPKGRSIHKKGITPDIKTEDTRKSMFDKNDAQLFAAQKSLKLYKQYIEK